MCIRDSFSADVVIYIVSIWFLGYALGSVEGRVAIQYVNPSNPKDNFTFKCHRSNGAQGGYQDIYAVSVYQEDNLLFNNVIFSLKFGDFLLILSDIFYLK